MKLTTPGQMLLTPAQIRKIAIKAVNDAVKGLKPGHIASRVQRAQEERKRNAELKATNMGYPRQIRGNSFLVVIPDYFACSGGCNAVHYLAAMLAETGAAVATTHLNLFNPMLPVREQALATDIAIIPDGDRSNKPGASRVCWWMLFYTDAFFKNVVKKNECVFVYEEKYLASVQAVCEHPVTKKDVLYLPHVNPEWCFPGAKTIESCFYGQKASSKGGSYDFHGTPLPDVFRRTVDGAVEIPPKQDIFRDGHPHDEFYAHQRTLAILRASRNFYTTDHHTSMSIEAALCGCKVWYVQADGTYKEQIFSRAFLESQIRNPVRDVKTATLFRDKVLEFFGC